MSFNCSSAFLGSSQKFGLSVFSSSSSISRIFLSMSKIPPQRFNALPEISQLFYCCHAAKIAKNAYEKNITLKKSGVSLGLISEEDFDKWVKPKEMVKLKL